MPRIRQTDPESQPVAASADNPARQPTPGAATDTPNPNDRIPRCCVFLATGTDAVTADTAMKEMEATTGC